MSPPGRPEGEYRSAQPEGTPVNTTRFDRNSEDTGNIVHLEHINLTVPDQLLATRFYVSALGLTRDPYLMTGVDNMWVNAGATQFHLPRGEAQQLRGTVDLVMPGRPALLERLQAQAAGLAGTAFEFEARADHIALRCPWGNRLRVFEPDSTRFGATRLGIVQVEFEVARGTVDGIARFYREVLAAHATVATNAAGAARTTVATGNAQSLSFRETAAELPVYDGHHLQIYVADFSGPHRRLNDMRLVSEESDQHQYRFLDITDPQTGTVCFRLEHEVRSMTHPLFRRPLVNRNPQQSNRGYRPGADTFLP
jgi:catechol 2,3-dioxygenase-like lactoylglutathione lyase family enzyme